MTAGALAPCSNACVQINPSLGDEGIYSFPPNRSSRLELELRPASLFNLNTVELAITLMAEGTSGSLSPRRRGLRLPDESTRSILPSLPSSHRELGMSPSAFRIHWEIPGLPKRTQRALHFSGPNRPVQVETLV